MNKTRFDRISKALKDHKNPNDDTNPYEGWSLQQLKAHYDELMKNSENSELSKRLNSMSLDQLMKAWSDYMQFGKMP